MTVTEPTREIHSWRENPRARKCGEARVTAAKRERNTVSGAKEHNIEEPKNRQTSSSKEILPLQFSEEFHDSR